MMPRRPALSPLSPLLIAVMLSATAAACAGKPQSTTVSTTEASKAGPKVATKITAFAVSSQNLNVDMVGLRDGMNKPDGNRDLAFTASIDGPFDAIFVVSANAKGEPGYGLRADTLTGTDEIPPELGGVIDTGKMTVGIGVVEGGRFINGESGSAHAGPGLHNLTLYIPNTATLRGGTFVRMYLRLPGGTLLAGPVTPY